MLQVKPISPASGRPMSDPPREDAVPSAPAMTEESTPRTAPPPTPGMGGRTAPAPPSQRRDRGAGAVGPLGGVEAGVGSASDREAGAEKEVGSWRGRLTARDRELVGHLGLVRYLRTDQVAELMFRGRAQSVLSARLGELADRHGNCRALVKRLWFVNGDGRRVQVWALTHSGYGLAEEVLGRRLKVPRHDVASQFLEHATGVNELYVALTKRPDAPRPADWSARRGKPADDFARVPTAFRWVPSEDLELPFAEYVREENRLRDRRLQPDALLEDPVQKHRYLIEYETGSATVRNTQHKTATLTKLARYSHFILGFADAPGESTYYSKHFADGFSPVVLFIARTAARRETIAEAAAGWAGGEMNPRFQVRSLTVEQACAEFRALIPGEKPAVPAQATTAPQAAPPSRASQHGVLLSWKEVELLRHFQEEALHAIQRVRHTVRAGQPVVSEPRYPEQTTAAERLLQWLLALRPAKAQ